MRGKTASVLFLIVCLTAPAAAQPARPMRIDRVLTDAAPSVRWTPEGLLVYSLRTKDGVTYRALDPRTGAERPFVPPPPAEEPRVVRPGLFAHMPPIREVVSSDGLLFAGSRGGDVYVRSRGSDEQTRLTTGGAPAYGYDIEGAKWSPDGRSLAVPKLDSRGVPTIPLVRWSEPDGPVVRHPYSRAGEPIPRAELFVVRRDGSAPTRVGLGALDAPYLHIVGWSARGDEVYFLRATRLMDRLELLAADPRTGESRTLLSESSETFIVGLPFLHGYSAGFEETNHVVMLRRAPRFVWTSETDGWRRLYLHDLDGTLIRPLSPAGFEVEQLDAVDEEGGWVYYTARVDREDPYALTLMRVRLEGGDPETLVRGPALDLELDPARAFFWTMRSGIADAPVVELRRADGTLVREIWSGDAIVSEAGSKPPERFRALAADGETPLFGLLFKPRDFDPERKYPVVDSLYLGPQTIHVPGSMMDRDYGVSQATADLGFIVVMVDARGTPGRGKAFQDAFFGRFGQEEIADHAGVLRQLAAGRSWMDLTRVGAVGHSWGGYGALRALLLAPDLYDVAVASAPGVDLARFRVAIEPYMGCLPADCPEAYARGSSTALADRLRGKLLLLHGTSDDDVPFGDAIALVAALHRAGKPYDLVVFPEGHHIIQGPYWWSRVTGYLQEHLGAPR